MKWRENRNFIVAERKRGGRCLRQQVNQNHFSLPMFNRSKIAGVCKTASEVKFLGMPAAARVKHLASARDEHSADERPRALMFNRSKIAGVCKTVSVVRFLGEARRCAG